MYVFIFSTPTIIAGCEAGATTNKIHEIYLSIANGKLQEVERLCAQGVQLSLHNWVLSAGDDTRQHEHFQELVELRESGQIMVEVSSHTRNRTVPDLKNLLATWVN